jgi:mRNA interferase HicA
MLGVWTDTETIPTQELSRVTSKEFKRWLGAQGAVFRAGKGSYLKVYLNGRQSVLPMHNSELKKGLVGAIKKQLGLK